VFEQAVERMRARGAELVDNVEIPGEERLRQPFEEGDETTSEGVVLQFEFKADLEAYLASRPTARIRNLADVIRFNEEHAAEEMPYFRQERLVSCAERGPLTDPLYQRALAHHKAFANDFAAFLREQRFDALIAPTNAPAWTVDALNGDRFLGGSSMPTAVAGFPLITLPAGFVFDLLPIGVTFMGAPWSEATLIKLAYAFEQAQPIRRAPRYVGTASLP
jgi:amidase